MSKLTDEDWEEMYRISDEAERKMNLRLKTTEEVDQDGMKKGISPAVEVQHRKIQTLVREPHKTIASFKFAHFPTNTWNRESDYNAKKGNRLKRCYEEGHTLTTSSEAREDMVALISEVTNQKRKMLVDKIVTVINKNGFVIQDFIIHELLAPPTTTKSIPSPPKVFSFLKAKNYTVNNRYQTFPEYILNKPVPTITESERSKINANRLPKETERESDVALISPERITYKKAPTKRSNPTEGMRDGQVGGVFEKKVDNIHRGRIGGACYQRAKVEPVNVLRKQNPYLKEKDDIVKKKDGDESLMDATIEVSNEVSNYSAKVFRDGQPETYNDEINQGSATTTNIIHQQETCDKINQQDTCDNEKHHCNNTANGDMEATNAPPMCSDSGKKKRKRKRKKKHNKGLM